MNETTRDKFHDTPRNLRFDAGLTLAETARRMGVPPSVLARMEANGSNPTATTLGLFYAAVGRIDLLRPLVPLIPAKSGPRVRGVLTECHGAEAITQMINDAKLPSDPVRPVPVQLRSEGPTADWLEGRQDEPVVWFFTEVCALTEAHHGEYLSEGSVTGRREVYRAYAAWSDRVGVQYFGEREFLRRFRAIPGVVEVRIHPGGRVALNVAVAQQGGE